MINIQNQKKAQVWVETAIYTLIGLTIIAIVLSVATPQIEKAKERSIISQTEDALNILNNEIREVEQTGGSVKIVNFKITKGKLEIRPSKDKTNIESNTTYSLENTKLEFSEEGQEIKVGELSFNTKKSGRSFDVSLTLPHEGLYITFNEKSKLKTLHASPTPYNIKIKNVGDNAIGEPTHIDFSLA